MPRPVVDPRFADTLRRLRTERGLSLRDLGHRAHHGKSYLHDLERGRKQPTVETARGSWPGGSKPATSAPPLSTGSERPATSSPSCTPPHRPPTCGRALSPPPPPWSGPS